MFSHSIVQWKQTPLMNAAQYTKSLALVDVLLEAGAAVNAADRVSAWEGHGVGCHMYGVACRCVMVVVRVGLGRG